MTASFASLFISIAYDFYHLRLHIPLLNTCRSCDASESCRSLQQAKICISKRRRNRRSSNAYALEGPLACFFLAFIDLEVLDNHCRPKTSYTRIKHVEPLRCLMSCTAVHRRKDFWSDEGNCSLSSAISEPFDGLGSLA